MNTRECSWSALNVLLRVRESLWRLFITTDREMRSNVHLRVKEQQDVLKGPQTMGHPTATRRNEARTPAMRPTLGTRVKRGKHTQRTTCCVNPFTQNVQNRQLHRGRKISGCLGLYGEREERKRTSMCFFLGDKNVLKLDCGDGCTTLWIQKNVHFKWAKYIGCKFYLNRAVF